MFEVNYQKKSGPTGDVIDQTDGPFQQNPHRLREFGAKQEGIAFLRHLVPELKPLCTKTLGKRF